MYLITRIKCPLMSVQAGIPGQQGWMDIQHSVTEAGYKLAVKDTHESGKNHKFRFIAGDHFCECCIKLTALCKGLRVE